MLSTELLVACWLRDSLIRMRDGADFLYAGPGCVENGGGMGEGHMEGKEGSKTESPNRMGVSIPNAPSTIRQPKKRR